MFELKILIDDIDYENAAEGLIPILMEEMSKDKSNPLIKAVAGKSETVAGAAKAFLKLLSQKQKDELLIKCFDANKHKLISKLENEARKKNIKINISPNELLKFFRLQAFL